MSDETRREFERLARQYLVRDMCPDSISEAEIEQKARSFSRMTLMVCSTPGCGAEVRQFDWLLPQQKLCTVCERLR